jgi:hypothetical protein
MPQPKTKASDIAIEAKRVYFPQIARVMPTAYARSICHPNSTHLPVRSDVKSCGRPRVTVQDCDPVDLAITWNDEIHKYDASTPQIPVVNMANERRAGGDWESALVAPEECFARRSNLVSALPAPWDASVNPTHYPIPPAGGLYSPSVGKLKPDGALLLHMLKMTVIFRSGPDNYQVWQLHEYRSVPVISVAPVRRPKLDGSGTVYSFEEEREHMREKMKTILRIAAHWGHRGFCLGAFGVGPIFRNPARETAEMWKHLLFNDREFLGAFNDVVFAIDTSSTSGQKASTSDLEIYRAVFDPNELFPTKYRTIT